LFTYFWDETLGGQEIPGWPLYGQVAAAFLNGSEPQEGFNAINDAGQVLLSLGTVGRSYLQSSAAQTDLGIPIVFPGATGTTAEGINNGGNIVGIWGDSGGTHTLSSPSPPRQHVL
jgi:hypothetical protein